MARQSPNRPQADEPDAAEAVAAAADESVPADDATADRSLWADVRIAPVEIALPGGVGLTLRAYRSAAELTPTELDETADDDPFDARERAALARDAEDDEDEEVVILDEEYAALLAEDDDAKATDAKAADADGQDEADEADEADEQTVNDEEAPVFLSHRGRLLAFKTPESLISFIRSGAPHDMAQLDTWQTVVDRAEAADIAAQPEDTYELDLVVENLRGGHDTWKLDLLIGAGEIARDLGQALRLRPVIMALSPGSPLDDLDEALRAAAAGGMGGFFGRRRLRKIGAQQASLGWRSVIGKISAAVDWRD